MKDVSSQREAIRAAIEATGGTGEEPLRVVGQCLDKVHAGRASLQEMLYLESFLEHLLANVREMFSTRRSDPLLQTLESTMAALRVLVPRLAAPTRRYLYYPPLSDVEREVSSPEETPLRGRLALSYGTTTAIYEYHHEYPLEGRGVPKERLLVVEPDGRRVALLDYCRVHRIEVFCERCGRDVTYVVGAVCPARARRW